MTVVKVVDSMMGTGKTSAAINMINNARDDYSELHNYIYITPYLDEVERIQKSANRAFYQPKVYERKGETIYKLDSLHQLLRNGHNIATTHSLFKMATEETKELIYAGNYTLILDEVMEVVSHLPITPSDVHMLFNDKWIYEEDGLVLWNTEKELEQGPYTGEFMTVKRVALNRNLILHNGSFLMWNFPADIFTLFVDSYILTYLFDAQIQRSYFDLHGIQYEKYIATYVDSGYTFVPGVEDSVRTKNELRSLIHIYDGMLNRIGDEKYGLSKQWYASKDELRKKLKNNILNYFMHIQQSRSEFNMWATFKDYIPNMKGKGYSKGHVSVTARATNKYRHKTTLAYTVNRFMNPILTNYFSSRGIDVNEDLWALSELLQWVWRSAIRDGKEISIYIPSSRMRELLTRWLDNEL